MLHTVMSVMKHSCLRRLNVWFEYCYPGGVCGDVMLSYEERCNKKDVETVEKKPIRRSARKRCVWSGGVVGALHGDW